MSDTPSRCRKRKSCPAAEKLRAWIAAGAQKPLTLTADDFAGMKLSLTNLLLFSGPLSERLAYRWRSFCSYMGMLTPFSGWKIFWYRRAGVSIGKNVYIAPGVVLDLLLPELITLEDNSVIGLGAMITNHIFTPNQVIVGRSGVGQRGVVGARAILCVARVGKESMLGANSSTIRSIPDGHMGLNNPLIIRPLNSLYANNQTAVEGNPDDQCA
ncbi:MAG: hypothetical protein LBE22_08330 [Azoarcus sp.]|jgi:acetyltransferase-like isoleucine patch superfamily enzyme|nr:hypothetical protein [Azoarcus sp.]